MSTLRRTLTRTTLPLLFVLCLVALTASYAYADGTLRPLATQIIGDPDAAVTGKLAVGTATPGNKALTVVGVIDFLGAGTVHNYFTQGAGNNMQINTNVDEANTVGNATKSQWKLVLGSSLDWFSIRRSPASGTYNEDALFFIEGPTGNVGIATVDTNNAGVIPFTPRARLDVVATSMHAIQGETTDSTGYAATGVYGKSASSDGNGVLGWATSPSGVTWGAGGISNSDAGTGVFGDARSTTGVTFGVQGQSDSSEGTGVHGLATASTGTTYGVFGQSNSGLGIGAVGLARATTGLNFGAYGQTNSTEGVGVYGKADSSTGTNYGVYGTTNSPSGYGVYFEGGLAGTGTKSAIVETENYGWRSLYAVESPQNWFEDFGQAELSGGEAVVSVEEIFAQTVNLDEDYHVFLTPQDGFCSLYVTDKTSSTFTVRAEEGDSCEITFDYRIIAPRLDYEELRLKQAENPEAVAANLLISQ